MRKLVVTTLARENLKVILEFVETKWGINARKKLANKIKKSLELIVTNPELFPKSEYNKRMYKCVITKQTTVFYTFTAKEVKVLSVFDTRQSPNRI